MRLLALLLISLLGACSSTTEKPAPTALAEFNAQMGIEKVWTQQIGAISGPMTASVQGEQIALASSTGTVALLQAQTGADLWRIDLGTPLSAGIGGDGQRFAVVTQTNEVVTMQEGKIIWRFKLPAIALTSPLVAGGRVFVLTGDRTVIALDGASGQKLWAQQKSGDPLVLRQAGILSAMQDTLVVGLSGRLVGMNPANGTSRWDAAVGSSRGTNEVERLVDLVAGISRVDPVICARSFQTSVSCVDTQRGAVLWTRAAQGHQGIDGDAAFVLGTESDGKLIAWHRATGLPAWQSEALRFRGLTAPVLSGRARVVGDDLGWVHWLNRDNGQTLNRTLADASGVAMRPVRIGNIWVVVSRSGAVQAYRAD